MNMQKKTYILIYILIFFSLFSIKANADANEDMIREQMEISGVQSMEENARVEGFDNNFNYEDTAMKIAMGEKAFSFGDIIKKVLSLFFGEFTLALKQGLMLVIIVMAVALVSKFLPEKSDTLDVAFYAGFAAILVLSLNIFQKAASEALFAVENMAVFMKSGILVIATLNATQGIVSLPAAGLVMFMTANAANFLNAVFLPLCFISASLAVVNNISKDLSFPGITTAIKRIITWGMGVIMTLYAALLTAYNIAGGGLKNAGGKAIKYAVGSFIPVVGSMLAESVEAVIGFSKIIKGAVGGAGIIAIVYMCLQPIIKLAAMSIIFSIISALVSPFSDGRLAAVINEFSSLTGIMASIVTSVCVMFVFSLALLVMV